VQDVNPFNPYHWLALAGVVAVLTAGYFGWRGQQREIGRDEVRAEWNADTARQLREAEARAASNRELQRLAEQRLHVLAGAREQFFIRASKEIRHAAAPLATCPVPDDVRVRLNAARECAIGDSAAACGAGDQLPTP
jgi:hypothetical protein